jgi:DNA-binding CsgD family transcriptional regulator
MNVETPSPARRKPSAWVGSQGARCGDLSRGRACGLVASVRKRQGLGKKARIALPPKLERLVRHAIATAKLAPRLHDVLRAALLGMTVAETAWAICLAENSVKVYRREICMAFGVTRIAEVARDLLLQQMGLYVGPERPLGASGRLRRAMRTRRQRW